MPIRSRLIPRPDAPAAWLLAIAALPAIGHAQPAQEPPQSQPLHVDPISLQPADKAAADAAPTITQTPAPGWTVEIEPILWYVGAAGDLKLPAGSSATPSSSVKLSQLNLDSTLCSPAGLVRLASGAWRFSFSGADYSESRTTIINDSFQIGSVVLNPGDSADVNLSFGAYQVTAGYLVYDHDFGALSANPAAADNILLRIFVFGGVLVEDVESSVTRTGFPADSSSASNLFVEPVIGVRFEADFTDQFGIDLEVAAGAMPLSGHSTATVDLALAFSWRPIRNVGIQLGWRQLAFWLSDGDGQSEFQFDGTLAGLFTGITIRF